MRRTDLSLYEKRLRKSVSGFRLRSKVQAAFRRSLSPLLEETPCPSYDALLRAFGPPEHMAQTLLQTMTTPPHPRGGKSKWVLAVSIPLLLIFGCFGALSFRDRPEQNFTLSDASAYSEKVLLQDYVFCQDRTFCDCDVEWDQPRSILPIFFCSKMKMKPAPRSQYGILRGSRRTPSTFLLKAHAPFWWTTPNPELM